MGWLMQELKKQFEIPGVVSIEPGNGGLTKIVITSPLANAEIYLQGAHVTHYQPIGQQPVLWMSKLAKFESGTPIRGGVPICFPWFGPREGGPKSPAHGFARISPWDIESITKTGDSIAIALKLKPDDAARALWPVDVATRYIVTVGKALSMQLEVHNYSQQTIRFEEALHTYLTVNEISKIAIQGLGRTTYLDKV